MEQNLRSKVRDTIVSAVDGSQVPVKVHIREQFPDLDEEDAALSTSPDPITGSDQPRTSVIEIGIPTYREFNDDDDKSTQIDFTFPIHFDFEAVQKWDKEGLPFDNSHDLCIALCLSVSEHFKDSRELLVNATHDLLQQVSAVVATDDKDGGSWHSIDWELTIHVRHFKH